jgi:hypothetical protein
MTVCKDCRLLQQLIRSTRLMVQNFQKSVCIWFMYAVCVFGVIPVYILGL